MAADREARILRLAAENPRWGYSRIHGEPRKFGHTLSRSAICDVLTRRRVPPAPERQRRGETWRTFLRRHCATLVACDCFTVETVFLRTVYVLFFLEPGSRRVHIAGCTAHPTAARASQQARQFGWYLQEQASPVLFLVRDRDATFPAAFDAVFAAQGVAIIRTPFRAPNANAYAERWVRTAREECLHHLLIANEAHLWRVLAAYAAYCNAVRPHPGLGQRILLGPATAGIRSVASAMTIIVRPRKPESLRRI